MLAIRPSNLSPEMRLLLSCCRTPGQEGSERIRALTPGPIDWQAFMALVDRHRVPAMVHLNLSSLPGNGIPDHIRHSLWDRFEKNARRALGLTAEVVRLLRLLEKDGIPAMPLKGPVLAFQLYNDLGLRHAGDLDLLVAPDHIARAQRLLCQEGYRRVTPDFSLSPRQQAVYTRQRCHFGYYGNDRQIAVELHWRLTNKPNLLPLDMAHAWKRSQTLEIAGTRVPTLSFWDTLLYLCTHGAIHAWFRLFWLCDVAELLRTNQFINWEQIMASATERGIQRPLAQGLVLSCLLLGNPLPDPIRGYLERDRAVRSLVEVALRIITQPTDPPYRPFTSIYILRKSHDFRLRRDIGYKLHTCLRIISTIPSDWHAVPLPDFLFPLYYVLRPFMWFWRSYLQRATKRRGGG